MEPTKEGDPVYLKNEIEVRWFLEHVPEAVREALKDLSVKVDTSGRIIVLPRMGCPYGSQGCLPSDVPISRDPQPYKDLIHPGLGK